MPQLDPNHPVIDEELRSLIPPLAEEERDLLEASMLADGQSDSITLWDAGNIVLDGHHRLEICRKHKMPVDVRFLSFETKTEAMVWMIDNQRGRRNLTVQQKLDLGWKRAALLQPQAEENQRQSPGRGKRFDQKSKPFPRIDTTSEAAKYAGVGRATAHRYRTVMERGTEEVKEKLRAGKITTAGAYNETMGKKPSRPKPRPTDNDYGTRPQCSVSDARSFAHMAITNLRQIRDDDPERQAALDDVVEWVNKHREKGD